MSRSRLRTAQKWVCLTSSLRRSSPTSDCFRVFLRVSRRLYRMPRSRMRTAGCPSGTASWPWRSSSRSHSTSSPSALSTAAASCSAGLGGGSSRIGSLAAGVPFDVMRSDNLRECRFHSLEEEDAGHQQDARGGERKPKAEEIRRRRRAIQAAVDHVPIRLRSEEHTSELQSQSNLVCRLLLEKKKKK